MWEYWEHLHLQNLNNLRITQDPCVVASFEQQSCTHTKDANLIKGELGSTKNIQLIYEVWFGVMI